MQPKNALLDKIKSKLGYDLISFFILLLVIVIGFLSVRTVFIGGEIAGWDNSFHYTNAYLTYTYFLPSGQLLGYDSWHMFGWSPNMYYNSGTTYFVTFLYVILSHFLDFKSTYNLGTILSYVLLAPALYLLVYSISKSRLAGLLSSLAAITIFHQENSWTDVGWRQIYYIGMWPERMGLVTGIFAVAFIALATDSGKSLPKKLIYLSLSSVFAAWSLLSHVMMGIATLMAIVFLLVLRIIQALRERDRIKLILEHLLITGADILFVLGLLSFWIIPLLMTNDVFHGLPTLTWEIGPSTIQTTLNSYPSYFNALIFLGPIISVVKYKRKSLSAWTLLCLFSILLFLLIVQPFTFSYNLIATVSAYLVILTILLYFVVHEDLDIYFLLGASILFLWLSTGPRTYSLNLFGIGIDLNRFPFFSLFAYSKFMGYARYLLLGYFSTIVSRISFLFYDYIMKQGKTQEERAKYAYALVLVLIFVILGFIEPVLAGITQNTDLFSNERTKKFMFLEEFPLYKNVSDMVSNLNEIVRNENNTYILVQDLSNNFADWKTFCNTHYIYELPLEIKKPIVGGIVWTRYITQPISTTEYSRMFSLDLSYLSQHVNDFYFQLKELGITYVVTFDKNLINSLRNNTNFVEVYSDSLFSIFKTREFNPIIEVNSTNAEISNVTIMPNYIKFTLEGKINQTYQIRIRLVNFPSWKIKTYSKLYSIEVSSFHPHVLFQTSQAWGFPVEEKIPFMQLIVKPASNATTFVMTYEMHTVGDQITKFTLVIVGFVFTFSLAYLVVKRKKKKPEKIIIEC